jgi:hypothetical protein
MADLKRALGLVCMLLATVGGGTPAYAQGGLQLVEQEIKAGLLYNFLRYTEWPEDHAINAGQANVVCVFGGDPFAGRLAPMAGRTVNQSVIELRSVENPDELGDCSLIFVAAGEQARWAEVRAALDGRSVLTVSDFDGFADSGGMIEFIRVGDRIGIEVNTAAVMAADLAMQDRLLSLATVIHAGGQGPAP